MPLDAITISALTRELAPRIIGAKIDKVQQPEKDVLLLTLRGRGENLRLLLSAGSGTARYHLTTGEYENPQTPPMFCMLLRKHLVGARISNINQPDMERLVILELDGFDEMGSPVKKQLIIELIGRGSNVILTGPEGHIIDCLRRVDSGLTDKRQVLPGLIYRLPPSQGKPIFFSLSSEERRELWSLANGEKQIDKWLLDTFAGLSPLVCRELSYICCGNASARIMELSEGQKNLFADAMDHLADLVAGGRFVPTMLLEADKPKDFTFMQIRQYETSLETQAYSNFSELFEAFYSRREKAESIRRRSYALNKTVKTTRDRIQRKLTAQRVELQGTAERETLRKYGDLITANLYKMKKGESTLVAEDYYEENCPLITINLDPLKTPQQNAASYYKEYNKAKTAEAHLTQQISKAESELDYLNSVLDLIDRAEGERDLSEIRRELVETGYIKAQKSGKREKIQVSGPMKFMSESGFEILVGKNNSQNDYLTMKYAHKADIWLHTQKIHGSHVIIRNGGGEVDDKTLEYAASLAAYYSQAREGGKVPVDYTQVRYVKKPNGSLPGMVIYTDYKTIIVEPKGDISPKMKKQ